MMGCQAMAVITQKLHTVFATVGDEANIHLPAIVVVGTQSSGKSSVIESLVGRSFLPRGTGIITRRPLVLQLIYSPKDDNTHRSAQNETLHEEAWATFRHTKERVYKDFEEIRTEIERETARITGANKGISPDPIYLKVYSTEVVNLTLVDLPGLTKVPVGDQPPDIEIQIRSLVMEYISNPNSIILAVCPANTDLATNESLKIAAECDPSGRRTLAVLTKLDLMDAGTDAVDVLRGEVIPVKLGIIGVVNRSQQDIIDNKTMDAALKNERAFLKRNYPMLVSRNGTPYLAKTLNRLLLNHIRDCLPELKARVNSRISYVQTRLLKYGDDTKDKFESLLKIITKFTSKYCAIIDGSDKSMKTSELCGGARLRVIFQEMFAEALDEINPLIELEEGEILTAIRNATGPKQSLFLSEVAFETLVMRPIRRLEGPSRRCVELAHNEMEQVILQSKAAMLQDIERFPKLHVRIVETVSAFLKRRLPPTVEYVVNLVYMELAYINTKQEDIAKERIECARRKLNEQVTRLVHRPKFTSFAPVVPKPKEASTPSISEDTEQYSDPQVLDPAPSTPRLIDNVELHVPEPGQEDKRSCEFIENLIVTYFDKVRKNIRDNVPKAIMLLLVNYAKDNLQTELVKCLYNAELAEKLLQESEHIAMLRKEGGDELKALQKGSSIINEISEANIK